MFFLSLILVISLTTDAFATGLSYGANKIKIPKSSLLLISFICSSSLAVAIFLGEFFSDLIEIKLAKQLSFIVLFMLGFTRLFDLLIKKYIENNKIKLNFSFLNLNFILTVYANTKLADADNSKSLSVKESLALSLALSLDSLAVGFATALGGVNLLLCFVLTFVMTIFAVKIGEFLGKKICQKLPFDLSYFSATLLICLAFLKIL